MLRDNAGQLTVSVKHSFRPLWEALIPPEQSFLMFYKI